MSPARDPWTPDDHLRHAAEILRSVEADEDGDLSHLTQATLVAVANVHARIAHASAALAMLEPRPVTSAEAPGLASLERLSAAVERLADAETR